MVAGIFKIGPLLSSLGAPLLTLRKCKAQDYRWSFFLLLLSEWDYYEAFQGQFCQGSYGGKNSKNRTIIMQLRAISKKLQEGYSSRKRVPDFVSFIDRNGFHH